MPNWTFSELGLPSYWAFWFGPTPCNLYNNTTKNGVNSVITKLAIAKYVVSKLNMKKIFTNLGGLNY